MFTGIIECAGTVAAVEDRGGLVHLEVEAAPIAAGVGIGDSVAVNGVCLTAVEVAGNRVAFDVVPETLARSSLGGLQPGALVNLERPLRYGGRLDGHLVQGHVDATGTVVSVVPEGESRRVRIAVPAGLERYLVEKGSIAVDGISLTVAGLGPGWFEVAVIPHTWEVTNLSRRNPGDQVNLEVDILAKHVERLLEAYRGAGDAR